MQESLEKVFDEIISYSHMWNWASDWALAKEIYSEHPEAYSVLAPFAYSYLEELIRSTTSEYGMEPFDKRGKPSRRSVGRALISLAKDENAENIELLCHIELVAHYFEYSSVSDRGDNRNSTVHGYMHPRYWTNESFAELLSDIANLSPYAGF